MDYSVEITDEAIQDLSDIYRYIALNDSVESAEYVFTTLEETVNSLSANPNRGSYPRELLSAGAKEFADFLP